MIIQSYLPVLGGAQRQVQRLGPLLADRGIETTVVTRHPPGTPLREQEPGLAIRRVSGPDTGPAASLNFSARGALLAARLKPDVIHVHDLLSPSTAALVAHGVSRAPVVAKVLSAGPGGDVARLMTKPAGEARLKLMVRRFSGFICLSDEVEDELERHGVPRERLRRIPNGVDTTHFRPAESREERLEARRAIGVPADDEPLWVYCGRFADVKRLDVLVEAMREAPGRLLLVGEGDDEERLRGLVAQAGLQDRVILQPMVDDTALHHRAGDAYLSASSSEGMSGSVLEAMATALPVVAAPASGMDELLGGGAGVVLDGAEPARFTEALARVAAEPEEAAAIGRRAREVVQERYALSRTADLLHELYEAVRR